MGQTTKVLVVDDSTITARQLEQLIGEIGGFEVVGHAKNGAEGIKLYGELKPDLVCMDVVMPVMDGLQATRSILRLDPSARVIVVSSVGGSRDTVLEATRLGARSVIAKPFDLDTVRRALEDARG
jgi:two-component system chemotaxis response regulator CheY